MRSKLVNRDEFIRWYEEERTYNWIIAKYAEKYGIKIGHGTISNWRHQLGLERRQIRDLDLIPWAIKREHRLSHHLDMLRAEARRRGGQEVRPAIRLRRLENWLRNLQEQDAVVHYDPETEEGFWLVPRRPGIDLDLIRVPDRVTRERGVRE